MGIRQAKGKVAPATSAGGRRQPSLASAAVSELKECRDRLTQLVSALRKRGNEEASVSLVEEAMGCVGKVLSFLQQGRIADDDAAAAAAVAARADLLSSDEVTSHSSLDKCGGKQPARKVTTRKRMRSHPYECVRSKSLEDGFTWRKYGQKEIQSQADRPRSYFRCTHKSKGCEAIRQVQISEEDPSTYIITYMSQHTCIEPPLNPLDSGGIGLALSQLRSTGSAPPALTVPAMLEEANQNAADQVEMMMVTSNQSQKLLFDAAAEEDMSYGFGSFDSINETNMDLLEQSFWISDQNPFSYQDGFSYMHSHY